MLYLVIKKFTKVFHIHVAFLTVYNSYRAVNLFSYRFYGFYNIG